jgi:hypothetical protein
MPWLVDSETYRVAEGEQALGSGYMVNGRLRLVSPDNVHATYAAAWSQACDYARADIAVGKAAQRALTWLEGHPPIPPPPQSAADVDDEFRPGAVTRVEFGPRVTRVTDDAEADLARLDPFPAQAPCHGDRGLTS